MDLPCHFNPVSSTVCPEEVSTNPVNSNSVGMINIGGDHVLLLSVLLLWDEPGRPYALPRIVLQIGPVDSPVHWIIVYCN